MKEEKKEDYLSSKEAAAYLNIAQSTILNWAKNGTLKRYYMHVGARKVSVFKRNHLEEFKQKQYTILEE